MSTLIVGFGHKARHGKDTVAGMVADTTPGARIFAFADDLKAIARALGMTTKNGVFLQKLGEACRALDQDFFVKRLLLRIREAKPKVALVPDLRYPNEFRAVRANGGLLVKVERVNADGTLWLTSDRDPYHESETALDSWTFDDTFTVPDGYIAGLEAAAKCVRSTIEHMLEERGVK